MELKKKIVFVTSGQPSTNPRLVKEADTLSERGFDVTVIYQYLSDWATETDKELLPSKIWRVVQVGGNPTTLKTVYFLSRVSHKIALSFVRRFGLKLATANLAIGRCGYWLEKEAKKHKADLYIAHNLAALPAACKAAKKHNAKFGFDAEDFHRQEITDNTDSFDYRLKAYIEEKYMAKAAYVTAASPFIAEEYEQILRKHVTPILNVFPEIVASMKSSTDEETLRLFWFSQTVGKNRGLEQIIAAIGQLKNNSISLSLLGNINEDTKAYFLACVVSAGMDKKQLQFLPPVAPNKIFEIASNFDIGIASEPGFCLNNKLALSNKIFTYLSSGLAILASNTKAQQKFSQENPEIGHVYQIGDPTELAAIIDAYFKDRDLLDKCRKQALHLAKSKYNWEIEEAKFLKVISKVLS